MDEIPNYDLPLIYSRVVKSEGGHYKFCSLCNNKEGCSSIFANIFVEKGKPTSKVVRDKIFELLWGCKFKDGQKLKRRYENKVLHVGLCHFTDVQKKINGEECSVYSFIGEKEAKRCYGEKDMGAYKIDSHYFLSIPQKTMESRAITTPSSLKTYGISRGISSIKVAGGKVKDFIQGINLMSIKKKSKKRRRGTPPTVNTNGSDEPQRRRNKPAVVDQDYSSDQKEEREEPVKSSMDLYNSPVVTSPQVSSQQRSQRNYLFSPELQGFTPTCHDTPLVASHVEYLLDDPSMNVDDNSGGLQPRSAEVNKKLFSVQLEKATWEELVAELNERCSSNDDNLEKVLVSVVLKQLDASTARGLELRMKLLERIFSWFLDTAANHDTTYEEEEEEEEEEEAAAAEIRRCNDDIYCETENYICLRRKSAYHHSQLKHETWKKYKRCYSRAIARMIVKITETYSNDMFVDKEDGLNLFRKEILDDARKRLKIKTSSIRILSVEEIIAIRQSAGGSLSTNQIISIILNIERTLGIQFSPRQLKKRIGELEGTLPEVNVQLVPDIDLNDGKRQSCINYFVDNPRYVLQLLVVSSLLQGSFQKSSQFSNLDDKLIFLRGTDRGNDDVIDMVQLANRDRGNTGKYSVPVNVLERGAETYANLHKTCFNEKKNALFEQINDGIVYAIMLSSVDNSPCLGGTCLIVRFAGVGRNTDLRMKLDQRIQLFGDDIDRFKVETPLPGTDIIIKLPEQCPELFVSVYTWYADDDQEEDRDIVVGGISLAYYESNNSIFKAQLDIPLVIPEASFDKVQLEVNNVMMLHTNDSKMNATIHGLGSCSVSHNCVNCLYDKAECTLPTNVEKICKEILSKMPKSEQSKVCNILTFKDNTLRKGENTSRKLAEAFEKDAGKAGQHYGGTKTEPKQLKETKKMCKSVTTDPLIQYDDILVHNPADPMHIAEGIINHANKECISKLQQIDCGAVYYKKDLNEFVDDAKRDYNQIQSSQDYKLMKEVSIQCEKIVCSNRKKLQRLREQKETIDKIENLENELEQSQLDRAGYVTSSGLGILNRRMNGYNEFLKVAELTESTKKLSTFSDAAYAFAKTIELRVGRFGKSKGGQDLTNRQCLKCTEKHIREAVHSSVLKIYDKSTNQYCQAKTIIDRWLTIMTSLEKVGRYLIRQEKVTSEDIADLKFHSCQFVINWILFKERKKSESNPLYLKIHLLFCLVIPCAEKTGMIGRLATEGFENTHFWLGQLKGTLSRMVSDTIRCKTIMHRQMLFLIPKVEDAIVKLESLKKRTGKRGCYNTDILNRQMQNLQLADCVEEKEDVEDDEGNKYFETTGNNLLPKRFEGIYYFLTHSIVSKELSNKFVTNEGKQLGNRSQLNATHVPAGI